MSQRHPAADLQMIPLDQIVVLNPRDRNGKVFEEIIGNIKSLGLKKPVTVTVEAPMAEKDALGNYRFLMQQAGKNMSADQFDAWMKANGIRVARGGTASAKPEASAASKPKR